MSLDQDELIRRLMSTFVAELDDHVEVMNQELMALESDIHDDRGERLRKLFRAAHSLKGAARSVSCEPIEQACHRLESLFAAMSSGERDLDAESLALMFATADGLGLAGQCMRSGGDPTTTPLAQLVPRLDDLLAGSVAKSGAEPSPPAIETAPETPPPPLADRSDRNTDPPSVVPAPPPNRAQVRVAADRLDALVAHSGELRIAVNRLTARAGAAEPLKDVARAADRGVRALVRAIDASVENSPQMKVVSSLLERLVAESDRLERVLRDDAWAVGQAAAPLERAANLTRMSPFAGACQGLARTVRDLANAQGKDIELVTEGGQVELDRSVLEKLRDPLLHLVRNAVDHGLETPAERRIAGKPERARLEVTACLAGASVEVAVADDGRGLDRERIRARAVALSIAVPSDDEELLRLVFIPGFSTAPAITEVSGRGVGLDVVATQVEALHGTVALASEPGRGTRFVLTVPLTVSTLRALLVGAGGQTFALVTAGVERLVRVAPSELRSVEGWPCLPLGGRLIPVASLLETLGLGASKTSDDRLVAVVLAAGGRSVAFVVDRCYAEQEIVIKTLGPRLARLPHVAAGFILADGNVALILKTAELVRTALSRRASPIVAHEEPRRRILVADDSATIRTLVKSIVGAAGYDVEVSPDGADAWKRLERDGADLVVSDVEMPGLDGFELTARIRATKRFAELPVVLVTSLASDADRARGMEVGASAYLVKSTFDQTTLLEAIAQLV